MLNNLFEKIFLIIYVLAFLISAESIDEILNRLSIEEKTGQMIPDVSLGTHFFNNIVELEILYFVLHPHKDGYELNYDFFQKHKNSLIELLPGDERWGDVVKIIDFNEENEWEVDVNMNALTQEGICYISKKNKE